MNPQTKLLLDEAKAKKKNGVKTAPIYASELDSESRKLIINNTCKRVIRTNKKAIELLADR